MQAKYIRYLWITNWRIWFRFRRTIEEDLIKKSQDRLEVLEKIKVLEQNGVFDVDVEDDPETIKLTADNVDYLKEKKDNNRKEYFQEYGDYPRNVIQFSRESKLYHPTQKPCNLMEYLISTYTKENELVLDFTSGSGSTLLGCEILNRRWIGIEITDKYCNVIKKRIQNGIQMKLNFDKEA